MPVVDIHTHIFPPSAREAGRLGTDWYGAQIEITPTGPVVVAGGRRRPIGPGHHEDIDTRIETMDRLGVDVQILSMLPPLLGYELPIADGAGRTRAANDDIAGWIAQRPQRFMGLAAVPAADVDAAIREMERSLTLPGFVGFILGTNVNGRNWDDPDLFPILEAAERLDRPVLFHPQDVRGGEGLFGRYHLHNGLGNPLETTALAASLIFGGVLDRLPKLRIVLVHAGGYLSLAAGRLDHIRRVRKETVDTTAVPPSDYLRRFMVDCLSHDRHTVRWLIDVFGEDRVVFGTDYPADMSPSDPVAYIRDNSWLSEAEKESILHGNLERELGLGSGVG